MTTSAALEPLPLLEPGRDYSRRAEAVRWREAMGLPPWAAESRTADVPYWTAPPGYCRWCGVDLEAVRKSGARNWTVRWHPACVEQYRAVMGQAGFRAAIYKRDGGVCAECPPGTAPQPRHNGRRCLACGYANLSVSGRCLACRSFDGSEPFGWEADHIVPLWAGGAHDLENGQTLCLPHSGAKTSREAGERAERRRVA